MEQLIKNIFATIKTDFSKELNSFVAPYMTNELADKDVRHNAGKLQLANKWLNYIIALEQQVFAPAPTATSTEGVKTDGHTSTVSVPVGGTPVEGTIV